MAFQRDLDRDALRLRRRERRRHRAMVTASSLVLTLLFFMVLPFTQAISAAVMPDLIVRTVDTAVLPPPPPPIQEEPEDEPEQEEPPPELEQDAAPLDLAQLELVLNAGFGGGWMDGGFAVQLDTTTRLAGEGAELFSLAELDQKPRAVHRTNPTITPAIRRKAPGRVYLLFVVNEQGRVERPIVRESSDPVFEKSAIEAVSKWRFEPGKRKGEPVRFRMGVPITFPEQ